MSRQGSVIEFTLPRGPIAAKYVALRDGEDFAEEAVAGPLATAKSRALMDFLLRRGFDYPGSNMLLVRNTLTSLKMSTLKEFNKITYRLFDGTAGSGSKNENEGLYRFPVATHPVTGAPIQSTLQALGVDRTDIDQLVRSTEFSSIFVEEADEVEESTIEALMTRNRQKIWHREKVVRDLCLRLSLVWGVAAREVYQILLDDPAHIVGSEQLPLDHPMPGNPVLKAAWNPKGDQPIWKRYCAVPYPQPYPTPEWAEGHVGIREVHWSAEERLEGREASGDTLMAGQIAKVFDDSPEGYSRRFVAREDARAGVVHLVRDPDNPDAPLTVPADKVGVIAQRNMIYVFPSENESRNRAAVANSFLLSRERRREALTGEVDKRSGLVFTNFVDDFDGGHVVPWGSANRDALSARGLLNFAAVDQGGSHATAIVFGVYSPESEVILIYDEYVRSGESARSSALSASELFLPGSIRRVMGFDPAMQAREFSRDTEYAILDEYKAVLRGVTFVPGDRGDPAFDLVNDRLLPSQHIHFGWADEQVYSGPRLLVAESCEYVRSAMQSLSWKMVRHQRDKWEVDVGDAVKILVSVVRKHMAAQGAPVEAEEIMRPRLSIPT